MAPPSLEILKEKREGSKNIERYNGSEPLKLVKDMNIDIQVAQQTSRRRTQRAHQRDQYRDTL